MSVGENGHCRAMPAHGHTLTRRPLESSAAWLGAVNMTVPRRSLGGHEPPCLNA